VPPEEFVQARNALVRQLREKGDAEEARRVAALRRPTASLWVVNQLGRRAASAVDQLVEATRRARKAQMHGGGGDELRETMHAQREAMQKLLGAAREAAGEIGVTLSPEQERRIQDTLQTAAATEPEQLRAGALEQELSASGFDALLGSRLAGAPVPGEPKTERKSESSTRAEERKRQQEEKRERAAQMRDVKRAKSAARQLAGRADQLDRQAREAKTAAERAKAKAEHARRAADEAAARLAELQSKT